MTEEELEKKIEIGVLRADIKLKTKQLKTLREAASAANKKADLAGASLMEAIDELNELTGVYKQ